MASCRGGPSEPGREPLVGDRGSRVPSLIAQPREGTRRQGGSWRGDRRCRLGPSSPTRTRASAFRRWGRNPSGRDHGQCAEIDRRRMAQPIAGRDIASYLREARQRVAGGELPRRSPAVYARSVSPLVPSARFQQGQVRGVCYDGWGCQVATSLFPQGWSARPLWGAANRAYARGPGSLNAWLPAPAPRCRLLALTSLWKRAWS